MQHMSQTIRVFWPPENGEFNQNFNWPPINDNSVVLVTASEYDPAAPPDADGSAKRFVGAAQINVFNVAPHGPPSDSNKGVTYMMNVNWPTPLNVCVDITVLDDTPITNRQVFYVEGAIAPAH
jgi:hypothetical protein